MSIITLTHDQTIEYRDTESLYTLSISRDECLPYRNRIFIYNPTSPLYVTIRGIYEYPRLCFNPELQYMEVGSGLGGLIPILTGCTKRKPIAIDNCNYAIINTLLEEASETIHSKEIEQYLDVLKERCKIITDPEKVYLIQRDITDVVTEYTELHKKIDVLIDCCGAEFYSNNYDYKKFLKESGVFIRA
jgi:hypothetical protein